MTRLGYTETRACPHCGSPLLKGYPAGPEQWACHNDLCELNRKPAGYEAAASVIVGIAMLVRTVKIVGTVGLVLGVIWLLWRALS